MVYSRSSNHRGVRQSVRFDEAPTPFEEAPWVRLLERQLGAEHLRDRTEHIDPTDRAVFQRDDSVAPYPCTPRQLVLGHATALSQDSDALAPGCTRWQALQVQVG